MDASRSWAESIAIQKGKIVYIGEDAGITPWMNEDTQKIDLDGKFVLP